MKQFIFLIAIIYLSFIGDIIGQGAAINKTGSNAAPSAMLDVSDTASGVLITRMTTAQRDAILNPANGLMIWNLSTNCLDVYIVNSWQGITCGCASPPPAPTNINGPSQVCEGSVGHTYSISQIAGANSYIWSVPAGATITANNGTTINVTFGNISGDIEVSASNNCGISNAFSLAVTVHPNLPASVNIVGAPTGTICSGSNITFTATPINGGTNPSYEWQVNGILTGSNSSSFSTSSLADGDEIKCIMTSSECASGSPATSNTITSDVAPGVTLTMPSLYNDRQVFAYTGSNQIFTVPPCINRIYVKMWAAGGGGGGYNSSNQGGMGGAGAYVGGYMDVTPGDNLILIVGGGGVYNGSSSTYGGGGARGYSSYTSSPFYAASGGGRTAIQIIPGTDLATAGGGGGGGAYDNSSFGGGGGAPNGSNGNTGNSFGFGYGGTTNAGGQGSSGSYSNSTSGSYLNGSAGGNASYPSNMGFGGGGGGGGYYGGSGGAGIDRTSANGWPVGCGGGGGASFVSNIINANNIAGASGNNSAPNNSDTDYLTGIGVGANSMGNGGNGRIVIYW